MYINYEPNKLAALEAQYAAQYGGLVESIGSLTIYDNSITNAPSASANWYCTSTSSSITYQVLYNWYGGCLPQSCPQPTSEQIAEAERRSAASKAAEARAEGLLLTLLTPEQRDQYQKESCFETVVNDRCYRIRKGRAMNVDLMENGKPKVKYCAMPEDCPPTPDIMLAQLLMLQTNEAKFLAIANKTVLSSPAVNPLGQVEVNPLGIATITV